MYKMLKKIIQYPRLTLSYPKEPMDSSLFVGKPEIDYNKCDHCGSCVSGCPSGAIAVDQNKLILGINLDQCIFCALCEEVCPKGAVKMTQEFELAVTNRADLSVTKESPAVSPLVNTDYRAVCAAIQEKIRKAYGRSLFIREIDSGSCNGCDYEVNGLNNPLNDLERFGMQFVASPRHADLLLITGAVTRNMELALLKTYQATPEPKLVVAIGACALSGGIFRDTYATGNGVDYILPVDVYVPGCPPRPQAILYGILKALNKADR